MSTLLPSLEPGLPASNVPTWHRGDGRRLWLVAGSQLGPRTLLAQPQVPAFTGASVKGPEPCGRQWAPDPAK